MGFGQLFNKIILNLRIVGRDNVPAGITCGFRQEQAPAGITCDFRQEQAPALQHWVLLYIARVSSGTMWASSPTDFSVQSINKIILDIFPEGIFGFIAAAVGKAEQGTAIIQNQICLKIYLVVLQDTYRTLPKIFQNTGGSKPPPYDVGCLLFMAIVSYGMMWASSPTSVMDNYNKNIILNFTYCRGDSRIARLSIGKKREIRRSLFYYKLIYTISLDYFTLYLPKSGAL